MIPVMGKGVEVWARRARRRAVAEMGPPFEKVWMRIFGVVCVLVVFAVGDEGTLVDAVEVQSLSTERTTSTAGMMALCCAG